MFIAFQALIGNLEVVERLEYLFMLGPLELDLCVHVLQLIFYDLYIVVLSTNYLIKFSPGSLLACTSHLKLSDLFFQVLNDFGLRADLILKHLLSLHRGIYRALILNGFKKTTSVELVESPNKLSVLLFVEFELFCHILVALFIAFEQLRPDHILLFQHLILLLNLKVGLKGMVKDVPLQLFFATLKLITFSSYFFELLQKLQLLTKISLHFRI